MLPASNRLTAASINDTLRALQIPTLNDAQLQHATRMFEPEHLRKALSDASTSPDWREWLRDAVHQIHQAVPATSQQHLPPPASGKASAPVRPASLPATDRLTEINRVLTAIGARTITVRESRQLGQSFESERLRLAIDSAEDDPRAAAFLRQCIASLDSAPAEPAREAPAPRNAEPEPQREAPETAQGGRWDEHVAYGKATAVSFLIADLTEQSRRRDGYDRTIMIKAAQAKDGQDCKNGIAWNTAICVNLGQHEVQFIASVLLGMLPAVRFAGHGRLHDKWFEVSRITDERFKGGFRVSVAEGKSNRPIAVNIGPTDIGAILSRFLRIATHQLHLEEQPNLLVPTLRASVELYQEAQSRKQGSANQR